jgi:hypothetical protein
MGELYDWRTEDDLDMCEAVVPGHMCTRPGGHDDGHHCDCGHSWPRVPHPSVGPP